MKSQQLDSSDHIAYQQAGHAVMSYLIRNGFTDKFVPISRSDCLPGFEHVTIEGKTTDWTKITSNLGSLVTVSQVLLAGYVSETIKYELSPRKSKLVEEAQAWLGAYVEEYYTDNSKEKQRYTTIFLMEVFAYVKENIQAHWACVDALANALLQQKTLSEEKAFGIIEEVIPEDLKRKAKVELSRTTTEKLAEIIQQGKSRKSTTKQVIKKRLWWEFWKN